MDTLNIWWAIIKRQIDGLDMQKLVLPEYELRVEAKIKVSHAPRRVNLHVNHSRTTDYHSHLEEYYIGDTSNWHVISMSTKGFDAISSDNVNVQLAIMDWGLEKYAVKVDYIIVDVVKPSETGPDIGNPLEYHPKIPPLELFGNQVELKGAVLDSSFPGLNFSNWNDGVNPVSDNLLSVGQSRFLIFRGDFSNHSSTKARGLGVLSIHLHHLERSIDYKKDFGHLRLVEIIGGWSWSGNFSDATLTPSSRRKFAKTSVEIVANHDLDGVDIDWEYPGLIGDNNVFRPEDKQNYTLMFKEIRKELDELTKQTGKYYELTTAVGAFYSYIEHTEMDKAAKYLDYVNLMTYDYYTSGDTAGHHSNLYPPEDYEKDASADKSFKEFLEAGVPA